MAWVIKDIVYKVLHPVNNLLNLKGRTLTPTTAGTAQDFTIMNPPAGHVLVVSKLYIHNPSTTDTATVVIKDGANPIAGPFRIAPGETIELSVNEVPPIYSSFVINTDYSIDVNGAVMVI